MVVHNYEDIATAVGSWFGIAFGILFLCGIAFLLVLAFIYLFKSSDKCDKYLSTLNEHDKSVIMDYRNSQHVSFKELFSRGVKHEKK